jgi:hypothetical protein
MRLSTWQWLAVDSLATFRLTRLATTDTITEGLRQRVGGRDGEDMKRLGLFLFATCAWCMSVWIAAGVVILTINVATWWSWLALVLAFSAVAGIIAEVI